MKKLWPLENLLLCMLVTLFNLMAILTSAQVLTVGNSGTYLTLEDAAPFATPGDTLLLEAQVFSNGTQFIDGLNGTASDPIVILAEIQHQSIFNGGTEAIHLSNCNHVEINGLVIEQQTGNGINLDDGGNYTMPSQYLTVRNCVFRDLSASGNNDFLKMSGIDNFVIENCTFTNGGGGGSGIDFVGCHYGIVQDCMFDDAGVTGIQNKGGSQFIRIQRNIFKNISQRALNLGGSTGLTFFRPPLPNPIVDAFEAADIEVFSNIFIGNWAPIAYVGCVRVKVYNNTFYYPENWVIRILQETTTPGFLTCADNEFSNNIVYLDADLTEVNIGPNTDPSSFIFTNNLWYNESNSSWSPILPVTDPNQIIDDPLFVDINQEDFRLQSMSPAIGEGFVFNEISTDYDQNFFYDPPSIGAFEGHSSISNAHIEVQADSIVVYPNPSANQVKIEGNFVGYSISVLGSAGDVVQTFNNPPSPLIIDLSTLPSGLNFIQIVDNSNSALELIKIIKM